MSALPIRLRLTLAFAVVMCALLGATGLFVYTRERSNLDHGIARALATRAADVAAIARQSDTALGESASRSAERPALAELLSHSGRVIDSPPTLPRAPLLSAGERSAALAGHVITRQTRLPGIGDVRLLAQATYAQDQKLIVVVGEALEQRDHALAGLREELMIGGPLALVLSCIAGYLLTAAALRPVDALRRRAAAISARDLDQRLPAIAANDELGRLQRTLDDMLARIYAAVRRERTFVSDASHELRSPITALRAELELLAREQPQGEHLQHAVASAIEEADRLARVADGLLVLARADDGQLALAARPTAASELLRRAAALAAGVAERRGVHIAVEADGGVHVLADPELALQALHNLLANAVRHASARVTLSARAAGGLLELHVRDDGPGFPEAFLGHAWERFARADAARAEEGSGLGLAIVRTIAAAHAGKTEARNIPGGGADVWIALPLAEPATVGVRRATALSAACPAAGGAVAGR
jgi:signal transduction histidine kinase